MVSRRVCARRLWAAVAAMLLLLYVGAVVLRVLYPVERLQLVRERSEASGLDPALVCSLIRAESRFHADSVSPRGAVGLLQLMPDTAAWISGHLAAQAYDLRDPETNLRFGTWYLTYLLSRFGRLELALAAYNAGPTRVDQWIATGETQYPETSAFVRRVLRGVPIYHILLGAPILVRITPSLAF